MDWETESWRKNGKNIKIMKRNGLGNRELLLEMEKKLQNIKL